MFWNEHRVLRKSARGHLLWAKYFGGSQQQLVWHMGVHGDSVMHWPNRNARGYPAVKVYVLGPRLLSFLGRFVFDHLPESQKKWLYFLSRLLGGQVLVE
jgi:hypothetical protein